MNTSKLIQSLVSFSDVLESAITNIKSEDASWRPETGEWSVLEIVTHLADEEQFDFKVRLRMTLENPEQDWPGIDPEGWVTDRQYNSGNLHDVCQRFQSERARSVAWLKTLNNPDWLCTHIHPKLGSLSAGDLLAAWVAHDWFHLRKIAKRRVQLIAREAAPHSIAYSGGKI